MNDRELLKAAAKAAGLEIKLMACLPGHLQGSYSEGFVCIDRPHEEWNPLTCDGDALRLAVKLKIDMNFSREIHPMHAHHTVTAWVGVEHRFDEFLREDEQAATRRAIVRAAATIFQEQP